MFRLTPVVRITLALVLMTTTLVLSADMLNLVPDPSRAMLDARKKVCESLAIFGTLAMERDEVDSLQTTMQVFVQRNPDVLFATLQQTDGTVLARSGYLAHNPNTSRSEKLRTNIISVPIFKDNQHWATVEMHFKPLYREGIYGIWERPIVKLTAFFISGGFFLYLFFMRKILAYLDPSSAIPARVKAALDTLAEGVVVLDDKERIVLANAAFAEKVGRSAESLMGQKTSTLDWTLPNSSKRPEDFPWLEAMREGKVRTGFPLALRTGDGAVLMFMVNSAPVSDGKGKKSRGALATFDDVTQVEKKNDQLQKMLKMLQKSRNKVNSQNKKLQVLATQDPLTGCLNRRSFYRLFENHFNSAREFSQDLSCVMVDIDHFKSINDRYGHVIGDQVLEKVAQTLRSALRKDDVICRYGGEEFCILLPHIDAKNAVQAAERFRAAIEALNCSGIRITASFGVSSIQFEAARPQILVDQADKALYTAKNGGRNRVVLWGQTTESSTGDSTGPERRPAIFGIDGPQGAERQKDSTRAIPPASI